MSTDLDKHYGPLRKPEKVDSWEDRPPQSLTIFDRVVGDSLAKLESAVQCKLLRFAARAKNYIWAMKDSGEIVIAVEELIVQPPDSDFSGYPRRRGYRHPSEEKKLGHPTLRSGGEARIAGELAFDEIEGKIRWVLNTNSGRYCKQFPPNDSQIENVADRLRNFGLDVIVDKE